MLTLISIQCQAGDYWLDELYLGTFLCVLVDHSDEVCRWVSYTSDKEGTPTIDTESTSPSTMGMSNAMSSHMTCIRPLVREERGARKCDMQDR